MINLLFNSPPDGYEFKNPDINLIHTLIFHAESKYWNSGAGQALIEYENDGVKRFLALTFHEDYGFRVEVKYENESYFVCLGDGDYNTEVEVYIGGDQIFLPSKFFVGLEDTWEIVLYFCETGLRDDEYEWSSVEEIDWHYRRE